MKKSDLYRELARVLDMCEGTNVDPCSAWKFKGCIQGDRLPNFEYNHPDHYSFAVAILEDRPIFVGDELYWKSDGFRFNWDQGLFDDLSSYQRLLSWQPPKKTFMLNGEDFPCPVSRHGYRLTITGSVSVVHEFASYEDMEMVQNAINKLLKDATK